jgi:hypothetical protein
MKIAARRSLHPEPIRPSSPNGTARSPVPSPSVPQSLVPSPLVPRLRLRQPFLIPRRLIHRNLLRDSPVSCHSFCFSFFGFVISLLVQVAQFGTFPVRSQISNAYVISVRAVYRSSDFVAGFRLMIGLSPSSFTVLESIGPSRGHQSAKLTLRIVEVLSQERVQDQTI